MALNRGQIHNLFQAWIVSKKEEDYKALYEATYDMVVKFAFVYLHNMSKSKQFADEIFVIIYNTERGGLPKFDEINWIYQIVKEECIEYLKESEKNEFDRSKIYLVTEDNTEVVGLVDIVNYNYAIFSNKPKYQEIVALQYLGEFTVEDISYILKKKLNNTKFLVHISNRWAKISIECLAFFLVTLLVFILGKVSKTSIDTTYVVPIILFLVGAIVAQFVAYKTRDLKPKK